ncbi:MAG: hypothetical protein JXR37_35200 [Kiritimatiellae bacterium]|nr:hypothetical protein [Kiritimatiellia bacterium]
MAESGIARAFDVLNAVAGGAEGGLSFSEIGKACAHIAPATLPRLLKRLQQGRFLQKHADTGLYTLGEESRRFARRVVRAVSRAELLRPLIRGLAEETQESAAYYELDGDALILVEKAEQPNSWHYIPVQARTQRMNLHYFSIVILAYSPEQTVKDILNAEGVRAKAVRETFHALCARTRREECLCGPEEADKPISRAVAPVFAGPDSRIAGALGLTMIGTRIPKPRMEELTARVRLAARRAGRLFAEAGVVAEQA